MEAGKRARAQLHPDALPQQPNKDQNEQPRRKRGRPVGALGRLSREAVEHAKATGELPHIFLLRISRGEVIESPIMNPETGEMRKVFQVPPLEMRIDAAKVAAPYFAPKLAAVEVMGNLNDTELDEIIRSAASQAGIGLGLDGEGEAAEGEDGDAGSSGDGWL